MPPKKQKRAATADSPPPSKKAKPGAAPAAPAPATLFTNDLFRVELAPRSLKYLAVATFEGKPPKPKKGQKKEDVKAPVITAASIRLFYRKGNTGAIEPTQKGCTLTAAGLRALAEHGPDVAAAVAASEPASFILDETPRARKLLSSTEWPLGSGKYHADVREWYAAKDGGWGATQKGVSLTAAELAAAVEHAPTAAAVLETGAAPPAEEAAAEEEAAEEAPAAEKAPSASEASDESSSSSSDSSDSSSSDSSDSSSSESSESSESEASESE